MTEVLVFVPGIMGSELWDGKGKVWPGNLKDGLFRYSAAKFERLRNPDLEPRDIIRRAAGVIEIYEPWIRAFQRLRSRETGGSLFMEASQKPTLICVPYDWRKPIEEAADRVARAIAAALDDHGADAVIHLAAHSMGGLVCRYLVLSDATKDAAGIDRVASLLTFGTPHKGAPIALAGAVGLHKAQFLDADQTATLVNDSRFPALYQLFPQQGSAMVWDQRPGHGLGTLDVFEDRKFAAALKLNADSLDAAAAFHQVIKRPWPNVRRFLFVGTRFATPTHFLWNGQSLSLVRTQDAGDGTVTLQGSVLEDEQIRFTDESHASLIEADQTRRTLQIIFNADGLLAMAAATTVDLSTGDLIYEHRQPIEIALTVKGPGLSLDGTLFLERARPAADSSEVAVGDFAVGVKEYARELIYDGPELTSVHVHLDGVAGPAVFRPVFETREEPPRRFVGPAFIVKRPTG